MALYKMASDLSLHDCMSYCNKTMLMSILDSGIDINTLDDRGRTPLHDAASRNYLEGVVMLLERGAEVNVKSYSGNTPLHEGIKSYDVVETLLNNGALPDCRNDAEETPLFLAVTNQDIPIINLLLSVDANIDLEDCRFKSPLHVAVSNQFYEITNILLDHGANTDAKCLIGLTPLHRSAEKNDCLTTQLLDMGANPNLTDELDESLKKKHFDNKFIFRTFGNTPLHIAAKNKFSSIVKLLLDGGANPDIQNKCGDAPLHTSVSNSDFESVQLLLEKGADVNLKTTYQENAPLHLAAKGNEPLMIDVLIQGGVIVVDIINIEGNTALHEAVNSMAPENVKSLLQAGANVNAQNEKGETPLHLAVSKSDSLSLEVTQILLDLGASVKLTNKNSHTVQDVACVEQLDLIKKHFVKFMTLYGSQFEVNVTIDLKGYESFHTSCLEELALMKKKKCGKYSFYDIFYMCNNPYYVNVISMEKELSLLHTELPIYGSMLKLTFKNAQKRFCVMRKLLECFNLNCLPVELKWKILTYLSDENLEYILKIVETC